MFKKNLIILFLFIVQSTFSQRVAPYTGSRILWDPNTQIGIMTGGYGRVIQLKNGNLFAVARTGNYNRYSIGTNNGTKWTTPKVIGENRDSMFNWCPCVSQLSDGTILVGYNPRPILPYAVGRNFGIRVCRSTDNGATWSDSLIYNASHLATEGCWEPAFLELPPTVAHPNGEVQCYFSNENDYPNSGEQNISMCRSIDKGLTWSTPIITSLRANYRDGMPVPLLLKNRKEIVYAIEDNGYAGITPLYRPTIIRTTVEDNWSSGSVDATSTKREMAFANPLDPMYTASCPFICQLPNGETIMSYHSTEGRSTDPKLFDMHVMVGNSDARQFKANSTPFSITQEKSARWHSIAVIDTGIVLAVGSMEGNVRILKGFPVNKVYSKYGTITVDGQKTGAEKWSTATAEQLYFGSVCKARCGVDFLYDNAYLYLTATVLDTMVVNNGTVNDGLRLLLDMDDVSTATPQKGTFNLFFDTNGKLKLQVGNNGTWEPNINTTAIKYAINITAKKSYTIEAAIPWTLFGKSAPVMNNRMAVAVEMTNCNADTTIFETIPDAKTDMPYTWVEFKLQANTTAIEEIASNASIDISRTGNYLKITSNEKMKSLCIYSFEGKKNYTAESINNMELIVPFIGHFGIMHVTLANGKMINRKIAN